jgi:hypothetical protein
MSTSARYVKFRFTCPNGHINSREEMAVGAVTESQAVQSVLTQQLKCEECKAPLQQGAQIAVLSNEPMSPSSERRKKSSSLLAGT